MKTFVIEFDLSAATVVRDIDLTQYNNVTPTNPPMFRNPSDPSIRYRVVVSPNGISVYWRTRDAVLGELAWRGGANDLTPRPKVMLDGSAYVEMEQDKVIAFALAALVAHRPVVETPNGTTIFDLGKV